MATVHKFIAYDDIEHSKGNEVLSTLVIPLSFGENKVELDLSPLTMVEAMDIPLGKLLEMGRPLVRAPRKRGPDIVPRRNRKQAAEHAARVREYARENGLEVPPEGHTLRDFPASLLRRYEVWVAGQPGQAVR